MTAASGRAWRVAVGAVLLLVLSNGPVLRFVSGVLGRSAHWNDWAVWPVFAGAAAASAVLAWVNRHGSGCSGGPTRRDAWSAHQRRSGERLQSAVLSRTGLFALCWYSAAAVASSLWGVYPSATLWRSSVYLGLALLAIALAGFSDEELAAVLALATSAAVGTSLAVVAFLRAEGVDHHGNWIGVYTNRNSLAPMAAIGAIAGFRWLLARPPPTAAATIGSATRRRVGGGLLVAASLVAMVGAGSRTAWSALIVGLAVASVLGLAARWMAPPRRRRLRWAALAGASALMAVAGAAAAAAAWNVPTFAQRRDIWSLVWDRVQERPWGGYGFFAFWEVPELVQAHALLQRGSAHNSLMETALGLGLAGMVPLLVLVALAVVNAGRSLWKRPSVDAWMWAALSVFLLVENLAESFVLWFSHVWVLLLVAALRRGPASAQPQGPRHPGTHTPRQRGQQIASADVL